MRNLRERFDYWKWWVALILFIVGLWMLVGWALNATTRDYVKCREAHKAVDICVIGG